MKTETKLGLVVVASFVSLIAGVLIVKYFVPPEPAHSPKAGDPAVASAETTPEASDSAAKPSPFETAPPLEPLPTGEPVSAPKNPVAAGSGVVAPPGEVKPIRFDAPLDPPPALALPGEEPKKADPPPMLTLPGSEERKADLPPMLTLPGSEEKKTEPPKIVLPGEEPKKTDAPPTLSIPGSEEKKTEKKNDAPPELSIPGSEPKKNDAAPAAPSKEEPKKTDPPTIAIPGSEPKKTDPPIIGLPGEEPKSKSSGVVIELPGSGAPLPTPPSKPDPKDPKPAEITPVPLPMETAPPPPPRPREPSKDEFVDPFRAIDPPKASPPSAAPVRPADIDGRRDPDPPVVRLQPPMAVVPDFPEAPARRPTPSEPRVDSYEEEWYSCQAGDTLERICQRFFNSDRYAQALRMHNLDRDGRNIWKHDRPQLQAGDIVKIPPARILERNYPDALLGQRPPAAPSAAAATSTSTSNMPTSGTARDFAQLAGVHESFEKGPEYVVNRRGVTFRDIARETLGSSDRWMTIFRLNRGWNPEESLPQGAKIRLPSDAR